MGTVLVNRGLEGGFRGTAGAWRAMLAEEG